MHGEWSEMLLIMIAYDDNVSYAFQTISFDETIEKFNTDNAISYCMA